MLAERLEGNLVGFPDVFCHPIERLAIDTGTRTTSGNRKVENIQVVSIAK